MFINNIDDFISAKRNIRTVDRHQMKQSILLSLVLFFGLFWRWHLKTRYCNRLYSCRTQKSFSHSENSPLPHIVINTASLLHKDLRFTFKNATDIFNDCYHLQNPLSMIHWQSTLNIRINLGCVITHLPRENWVVPIKLKRGRSFILNFNKSRTLNKLCSVTKFLYRTFGFQNNTSIITTFWFAFVIWSAKKNNPH